VTRIAQKRVRHGGFAPLRHETSRHWRDDCAAAQLRASIGCVAAGRRRCVRGRPVPVDGTGGCRTGVPSNTFTSAETPKAYGSCARCNVRRNVALSPNSASPTTAVISNCAARTCRHSVKASCHFGAKVTSGGMRARVRCAGVSHVSGTYNCAPKQPGPRARPQGDRDGDLAVGHLAQRPTVLSGDADRRRALFRETRAVENQHAPSLGHDRAQALPQRLGAPRRVRDEVLKRVIRARIARARPHRFHRLAAAVVEQARDVATQRSTLTLSSEAVFELLEPGQQPPQPGRRGVIEHCRAA
jgi:hypothetical protein